VDDRRRGERWTGRLRRSETKREREREKQREKTGQKEREREKERAEGRMKPFGNESRWNLNFA